MSASAPDGLLLIDKPAGWTSHDVVARTRGLARTRRVGHAGTLDPMATGVLVLGIGRATRLLTFLVGCDKAYSATIRLGQSTLTDDADGEITAASGATAVSDAAVTDAVAALTGDLQQVPSAVSAVKIAGERAYHRVRAGEDVHLPARPVRVGHFAVTARRDLRVDDLPVVDLDVEVEVSSGTYVRALARDLGAALGCGGHLTALRRTRVGGYPLALCHPLDSLIAGAVSGPESLPVLPMADAARAFFPVHDLSDDETRAVRYGQRIASLPERREGPVAALSPDGELVAMLDESRSTARSHVVFPAATS